MNQYKKTNDRKTIALRGGFADGGIAEGDYQKEDCI